MDYLDRGELKTEQDVQHAIYRIIEEISSDIPKDEYYWVDVPDDSVRKWTKQFVRTHLKYPG
jgi:hypothetical protein